MSAKTNVWTNINNTRKDLNRVHALKKNQRQSQFQFEFTIPETMNVTNQVGTRRMVNQVGERAQNWQKFYHTDWNAHPGRLFAASSWLISLVFEIRIFRDLDINKVLLFFRNNTTLINFYCKTLINQKCITTTQLRS